MGHAQSLESANLHFEKDGKCYLVENGRMSLVNDKVVTVKLKVGKDIDRTKLVPLRENKLGYVDLEVPDGVSVEVYARELAKNDIYEIVKYNTYGLICDVPDDNYIDNQWYLDSIRVFDTWDITMGSANVKVAVIDVFPLSTHSDLDSGYDSYSNIDRLSGYDYTSQHTSDHGLSVAGVISAKTNNVIGIAGIGGGNTASGVCIFPFNVSAGGNFIDMSAVDDAIINATDNGAKVINMSFRSNSSNHPDVNDAINYAYNHGVVLVAATGNDNMNNWIGYPASNLHVIAVGSVGQSLSRSDFSNVSNDMDLVAPGENIYTIRDNDGYSYRSGTSFATPQVAGVAALMLSVNPNLTCNQVRTILCNTARDLGNSGFDTTYGYGLVDAHAAVINAYLILNGAEILYDSGVYSVQNLPTGYSASWSLTGDNASNFTLQPDSLSTNQCTIKRKKYADYSGSTCLQLSAQISRNNTLVTILTKEIIARYISGETNPCNTEIYSVEGLPSGCTVSWNLSGTGYSVITDFIPTNPENNNYLGVRRTSSQSYASGTITATIMNGNSVVGTLTKHISSAWDFNGTWYYTSSFLPPYIPDSTPQELQCGTYLVNPNENIVLQSDNFIGVSMTCTSGNASILHFANSNTVRFNTGSNGIITIEGSKSGTCKAYRFSFNPISGPPILEMNINGTDHEYVFSLHERQTEDRESESQADLRPIEHWQLTILQLETNQKVFDETVFNNSVAVKTTGWESGVYIAIGVVDGQTTTKKLYVP